MAANCENWILDGGAGGKYKCNVVGDCARITPAAPGPSFADPNIMELCFHNGEAHMKEKVISRLMEMQTHVSGAQHAQLVEIVRMVEGL